MLSCTVDLDFFRGAAAKTVNTIQVGVLTAARKAALEAAAHAKKSGRFHDRTGNLRDRIYAKYQSGTADRAVWSVISPAGYSKFVELGTKDHFIRPKNKLALMWFGSGGEKVFSHIVHHPGTLKDPFLFPALIKAKTVLWLEIDSVMNKVSKIWQM